MPALTKAQQKQMQAAEDSFNRTYASQFGDERWENSLRPALAAPTRYAVLINRWEADGIPRTFTENDVRDLEQITFPTCPTKSSQGKDGELGGAGQAQQLIAYRRRAITSEPLQEVPFPAPQGVPFSSKDSANRHLMSHWNLDAASLLAVSVLAPKPGDRVLDLCAAPGGKSLAIAQLLRPSPSGGGGGGGHNDHDDPDHDTPSLAGGCLHSNEVDPARHRRLAANLAAYLPAALLASGAVRVLRLDATGPGAAAQGLPLGPGGYDKVLLDAPCSSERHVLHAQLRARQGGSSSGGGGGGGDAWRSGQSKKTARTQAAILMTALRAVRVGGRVLYATCSLSEDENDGVVDKGRELVAKERKKFGSRWDVAVCSGDWDGSELSARWAERTRYGWIVLPDHPAGGRWGPLFFAMLEKVAK